MKKILLSLLLAAISVTAFAQTKGKAPVTKKPIATVKKITTLDSASYGFGMMMGTSLKSVGLTAVNYDMIVKALKDSFTGTKTLITQDEAEKCIQIIVANMNKQKFLGNITAGKAFLEKNKALPGLKITPSGIQYIVLTQGVGEKPTALDTVTVNYRGTSLNGVEFDSSYKHNEPATFALNRVIAGWTEGLQLMPVGSKYRFFVPYNLAYGEHGNGPAIQPYETLIFDIELLKITRKN